MNYVIRQGRRIEVETVETGVSPKKIHKPFKARWVKLPLRWVEVLQRSKSVSTYQLALAILIEGFKRKYDGGEIVLSSMVAKMPRCTKMRAAKKLADLGLIKIRRNGRQALRVSINCYIKEELREE